MSTGSFQIYAITLCIHHEILLLLNPCENCMFLILLSNLVYCFKVKNKELCYSSDINIVGNISVAKTKFLPDQWMNTRQNENNCKTKLPGLVHSTERDPNEIIHKPSIEKINSFEKLCSHWNESERTQLRIESRTCSSSSHLHSHYLFLDKIARRTWFSQRN